MLCHMGFLLKSAAKTQNKWHYVFFLFFFLSANLDIQVGSLTIPDYDLYYLAVQTFFIFTIGPDLRQPICFKLPSRISFAASLPGPQRCNMHALKMWDITFNPRGYLLIDAWTKLLNTVSVCAS